MSNYYKLALFWILQVICCLLYLNFSPSIQHAIFFTIAFIISAVVFTFTSTLLSFTYYVAITLLSSFYYMYLALSQSWTPIDQRDHIIAHFISIASLFILFISSYHFKKIAKENIALSKKLKELEGYILNTKVLSQREFENRAEIVMNAMKRRNENGYLITINLAKLKKNIRKSIFYDLSDAALISVRNQFDLVGQFETGEVKILVQNTNKDGIDIVLNRLFANFNKKIDSNINNQLIINTTLI
ncbi:hypothetical protein ACFCYN_09495 [Gottfriedia sp. NPDC056225]|uniref:hypothetical protein n=1 Tax=Gottfriedia sp. NPDC056225 TaxID=3345751 RepID=UPI0035D86D37